MKVRAIAPGFYIGARKVGDEFDIADSVKIGSWMEPVDAAVKPAAPEKSAAVKPAAKAKAGAKD